MSQELERVYTINLGKVLLSVDTHRAPRAINMIKEFARHHMKTSDIKIEEDLAHIIWSRGVRSPPRKIRVRMSKTDEGYILVSPYADEKETPAKEVKKETPAKEVKKETPSKEVKKETPSKKTPKKSK
ncbi:MAG: 50S ribosomal protein L31 [Nitrosopumilales archaeon CG_4_9_14_0_8_um_filter_34_10]|nr:MAG: 50S ribosomal protein L31 [Nitrosopumilales archaeon CG_4_9_14_0_8_um_filter_34_10]